MDQTAKRGALLALAAYGFWGMTPIYFKLLETVPPLEIVAHRVVWSFLFTLFLIVILRKRRALAVALKSRKTRLTLLLSTVLIAINWGLFIWAVNSKHMLSASLGYYINPLVNIFLGMLFLGERLDRVRSIAAAFCAAAVLFELIRFGSLPWIALVLAGSFGLYGLVRKRLAVDSFTGMALETGLLLPLAAGYLLFSQSPSTQLAANPAWLNALLLAAGPVTMFPLLCFTAAANRISLTALGFFQYLAPSGMFLLAVFVYGETLSSGKLITFGLIWTALALLAFDSVRKIRQSRTAISAQV